jgi:hypothetical protein
MFEVNWATEEDKEIQFPADLNPVLSPYESTNYLIQSIINDRQPQYPVEHIDTLASQWSQLIAILFRPKLDNTVDPDWFQWELQVAKVFKVCFLNVHSISTMKSISRMTFQIIDGLAHHQSFDHRRLAMEATKHFISLCPNEHVIKWGYHEGLFEMCKDLILHPEIEDDAYALAFLVIDAFDAPFSSQLVSKYDHLLFHTMSMLVLGGDRMEVTN